MWFKENRSPSMMDGLFGKLLEVIRDPSDSGILNQYHWEHNYTNQSIKVSKHNKHKGFMNNHDRGVMSINDEINRSRNTNQSQYENDALSGDGRFRQTFCETVETEPGWNEETAKTEKANYLALIQERDNVIALKNAEVCI